MKFLDATSKLSVQKAKCHCEGIFGIKIRFGVQPIDYLTYEAADEDIRQILISAVQSTTGDSESYKTWNAADISIGSDENKNGEIVTYRDERNMFSTDVQKCLVKYNQSTLQPVPEEICRHPDFKQVFGNTVPHSAELVDSTNLHSVEVVKGNFLIEAWKDLAAGEHMFLPGCPKSAYKVQEPKVIETKNHPYKGDAEIKGTVSFNNVDCFFITFDPKCETKEFYANLEIEVVKNDGEVQSFKYTGNEYPKDPVKIFGNKLTYDFSSITDNDDEYWGIRFTVTPLNQMKFDKPFTFNKVKYGGSEERIYKYDKESPGDIPWLSSVLDPVMHAELTDDKDPRKIKWMKFQNGDMKDELLAKDMTFLLPVEEVSPDIAVVTILALPPRLDWWMMVKVSKIYQYVEVYNINAFGRRGYPSLVYTSDFRVSLAGMPVKTTQNGQKMHFPPSSITRFSAGNFFTPSFGGNNVLITDQNNGEDGLGPRTYLLPETTNGTVPCAISESFDFWELKRTGNWKGHRRVQKILNEKGEYIDFVDSYYDYDLEVRGSGGSTAIVRKDTDPVTLTYSGRRLVNLAESKLKASTDIVRLLTQIESLSHILAWSTSGDYENAFDDNNLMPDLIELPRLRVSFSVAYLDDGNVRLYVVDSGGKYVMSEQENEVNPQLLKGIPCSLLLTHASSTIHILVPNYPMVRPAISFCPFTVSTVPDMFNMEWQYSCHARYFLYEVHPCDQFVTFNSIGATLYWAFLKLLHREYIDAYTTIVSCGTDMRLSWTEHTLLKYFKNCDDDHHPNAHACRLKLRLVLKHSPIFPDDWPIIKDHEGDSSPLADEYSSYITKRSHVSLACRLSHLEETILNDYIVENELSKGNTEHKTRISLINKIETSTEPMDGEYDVYYYSQKNGGWCFASGMLSYSNGCEKNDEKT